MNTDFIHIKPKKNLLTESPFPGFWMAGYECSDKLNVHGDRVDLLNVTGHIDAVYEDYELLHQFNIKTVREGIRWSFVEKQPYTFDFSVVKHMMRAANHHNIQQVWDLCHFGYPDDLSPLHPHFAKRFVALCCAFVELYRSIIPSGKLIITPVNEVSFISWLGGQVSCTTPYCHNFGWQVKYALMKAFIAGVAAMKKMDDDIVIMSSEPLVNIVPGAEANTDEIALAAIQHQHQFQATDMLCGSICPELNGDPSYLDIVGLNYYYNNQWIVKTDNFLGWNDEPKDIRWRPLNSLIEEVYNRYHKPVVISETSHPKEDRPIWMQHISEQVNIALSKNIPLWGVCIYPIIDRPDWDKTDIWHNAGLWDAVSENGTLKRVLCEPYAAAFLEAQIMLRNKQVNQTAANNVLLFEHIQI